MRPGLALADTQALSRDFGITASPVFTVPPELTPLSPEEGGKPG